MDANLKDNDTCTCQYSIYAHHLMREEFGNFIISNMKMQNVLVVLFSFS